MEEKVTALMSQLGFEWITEEQRWYFTKEWLSEDDVKLAIEMAEKS